ncbi:MAG TPA: hypothetical protein VMR41_04875 [Patescibacteria group bacterium]|nr:hypothetical protein [Patescibacteria group bacterium]
MFKKLGVTAASAAILFATVTPAAFANSHPAGNINTGSFNKTVNKTTTANVAFVSNDVTTAANTGDNSSLAGTLTLGGGINPAGGNHASTGSATGGSGTGGAGTTSTSNGGATNGGAASSSISTGTANASSTVVNVVNTSLQF